MKSALVTGGGARLGTAFARRAGAMGFHVLVHHRTSAEGAEAVAEDIRSTGGSAETVRADLEDEDNVTRLSRTIVERKVCLLVNNASSFHYDDACDFSTETALGHFRANTLAPAILAQAVHAVAEDDGTDRVVVNIVDNKVTALNPDYFTYSISKAALHAVTQMLAMRFAPLVRVCGIAPGITLPSGGQTQEEFETSHRANPLGGGSTPEQLAEAMAFIVRTPSINGETIVIDGGSSLQRLERDVHFVANGA
jgi:NAD(P)-dependent dehydrogenase (short-subunit alcohol dehydrogenase family)